MANKDQKSLESIYSKILLRENFGATPNETDETPDEAPTSYSVSGDHDKKEALADIFRQHNLPASEDAIDAILAEFGLGGEAEEEANSSDFLSPMADADAAKDYDEEL